MFIRTRGGYHVLVYVCVLQLFFTGVHVHTYSVHVHVQIIQENAFMPHSHTHTHTHTHIIISKELGVEAVQLYSVH